MTHTNAAAAGLFHRASRPGFSLLEMVIVIVIISIVIGAGLAVGGRVVGSGKERSTRQALASLDQALLAYSGSKGSKFPRAHVDDEGNEFPLADAVLVATGNPVPSGLYAAATLMADPASRKIMEGLPSDFVQRLPATSPAGVFVTGRPPQVRRGTTNAFENAALLEVRDAWGTPVRFVHPEYHGQYTNREMRFAQSGAQVTIQLTRSIDNSDGGLCPQNKPYFYSAGPDKRFETREDNLYSIEPKFN